jgi:hypothetical protein
MTRFRDFTQFTEKQYDDVHNAIEVDGVTADLYRFDYDVDDPAITTEIGSEARVRRIVGHLAQRQGGVKRVGAEGMKITKIEYIFLTTDEDIRIDDVLRIAGKKYTITQVDRNNFRTEVLMERKS